MFSLMMRAPSFLYQTASILNKLHHTLSQTGAYKFMQLQSRERFRRFGQHRTARTMRQTIALHHMCLPLYWRESLPQRFNTFDRTPFGRT
jgi:hypothetical protein